MSEIGIGKERVLSGQRWFNIYERKKKGMSGR
jgi:hypothetical protein